METQEEAGTQAEVVTQVEEGIETRNEVEGQVGAQDEVEEQVQTQDEVEIQAGAEVEAGRQEEVEVEGEAGAREEEEEERTKLKPPNFISEKKSFETYKKDLERWSNLSYRLSWLFTALMGTPVV